ncbi:aldo/keto reductase [Sphaerothrix gracilis]|uniref:aldo/keto reductase n=1 Tax=Sphaerothrix gracilis TaxID=3151835 RepID=UPI0031FD1975
MTSQVASQTVTLVPNGPTISALGVGTWAWGDSLFWNYGKDYGEAEVQQAFAAALAAGVSFFDTAEIYGFGESERLIGQFLKSAQQPVHIATKYFPLPWRFSEQAVADALTASLDRLQVPAIALYQVHWPFDFFMGQKTLMTALAQEVQQGRIQSIGVSNYSAKQMREAHQYLADLNIPLAVNQVQYSLLHRKPETNGVLETAKELGITLLAYSPLAQGRLTGKYTFQENQKPTGARQIDPRFNQDGLVKIELLVKTLQQIGAAYDRTPAQVALNWLIAQGNIVPIPGAKNAQQASQNAGALGWSLTAEELEQLNRVSLPWR